MDIRDSDLPYLPYKEVWQYCIVDGCKGRCKMRDYGLFPYYWWPVKVRYSERGYRGGWSHFMHRYACSKHWKQIQKREIDWPESSEEFCLSKFVPVIKKKPIANHHLKL